MAAADQLELEKFVKQATHLCEQCEAQGQVKGIHKLQKKCMAELKFLNGLRSLGTSQLATHLRSSNLGHLEASVEAVTSLPDVTHILATFCCPSVQHPLVVDVVCNHGYTWVKVIARKAQAMHLVWAGQGQFGERTIEDQAQQYIRCAEHNRIHYRQPQVIFQFTQGITETLKAVLEKAKVTVQGQVMEVSEDTQLKLDSVADTLGVEDRLCGRSASDGDSDEGGGILSASEWISKKATHSGTTSWQGNQSADCDTQQLTWQLQPVQGDVGHVELSGHSSSDDSDDDVGISGGHHEQHSSSSGDRSAVPQGAARGKSVFCEQTPIQRVNLDITSLICIASNLCYGRAHFVFEEKILTQQAERERASPLLPKLHAFMEGKELYICETAVRDFQSILKTVGGPVEKTRADDFLSRVTVVPDQPSQNALSMQASARIKDRAKIIFGTGDSLQATTMTANEGFLRAAQSQGVHFSVFLHESRALTEQKESTAQAMQPS